ncbi:unnamed protein product [Didymodactylos carnosus]|uniref:Tyrosine-protein kinase ephrin type A/B receptor-like domain-containing protein n=1 Tax=Didymodactylos carnosus TaxID=1234261 RepID=A0A815GRV6_9BILA|nr:unnamed protein product [Didymodactylos carnosus]CAF1342611.1 unnamed protein product [Didymodactylos carnosus]CAF4001279.1 unnamed protein product [Didymodactylos carnosus]CAF4204923.1 unnamed protein product [Didymodactylos carnosus]
MGFIINMLLLSILLSKDALSYTKVTNDYDLYGIKIGLNDLFEISADNLYLDWYIISFTPDDPIICIIYYNSTTCDFVYSVTVPIINSASFVYNCIDQNGNNVIGYFAANTTCNFQLINEQIISNYSTQDNFIVTIDGNGTGVYGFADDFIFFYNLQSPYSLTVWPNTLNISPRAVDIGSSVEYAILVGYCQSNPSSAVQCGFILTLNRSLLCPNIRNNILLETALKFNWSDPRNTYHLTQSRVYSANEIISVSITWRTRYILIGVPSLNIVLLYSFDNISGPISVRQNGIGMSGFGKSVAWLDDQGTKAVILANNYLYSTNQWVSSQVFIYDIQSDGFTDETQPILIYPNSEQTKFQWMSAVFIRLACSKSGHLSILDNLGNEATLLSAPAGMYPYTKNSTEVSTSIPCIRGTYRNYSGIELCFPCLNGTFSTDCQPCISNDSFCPIGSIQNLSYSVIKSIEQDQEYPESPENTVFDDLLMQNIFSINTKSGHCVRVSPITWVLVVMATGVIVIIAIVIYEYHESNSQGKVNKFKKILKGLDIVGEGEYWIGGIVSTGIVVLVISASHEISVQLVLPGLKTVGAIRLGLYGPAAVTDDRRTIWFNVSHHEIIDYSVVTIDHSSREKIFCIETNPP